MVNKKITMLWMQAGACSGDTMSLLCADRPSWPEFVEQYGIDVIWQPSLSTRPMSELMEDIDAIINDKLILDILCVEGSLALGPNGTGMFDTLNDQPKAFVIKQLAEKANNVVAVGTCAAFGGVPAAPPNPTESTGMQSFQGESGGLLDNGFKSRSGQPVINISGCPTHPNTIIQTLISLVEGYPLDLNHFNQPGEFYSTMVHQGCTRNEYHEYDIEEEHFGEPGCLFYNLGCQGPYTSATCNTELWNNRSSKTREGVPCLGCVSPDFPRNAPLFKTEKVGNIPVALPLGVSRPRYMAYKDLANDAAPIRIIERKMKP
ncbi:NADH ubiquinone oxidoreductase [Neptuniibacter caesariensis]|uniref:hydrogenase (acceptor) n=1 Tax=Neptuniibacter caesariensis TaxID=207954 RepID=A0A7U8C5S6_NEPCE|nr:NADH ubiquinone oxidoreductase [Neptuniibacter caesariensis]EAR60620.1 NADH ubiquinone oxidoreductase, 20 kDa subunit [Oceanospirillum sp. MED92] [Neptuniibacter caesariensis]